MSDERGRQLHGTATRSELGHVNSQLAEIRDHLGTLQAQVTVLQKQQAATAALLNEYLHKPEPGHEPSPSSNHTVAPVNPNLLADCARDIVRILRESAQPLTTLEILDALVHHHLSWREATVRHALTELMDKGMVRDTSNIRPHSYGLGLQSSA